MITPRDKQNLIAIAKKFEAIEVPKMESADGEAMLNHFKETVTTAVEYLERKSKEL